MGGILYTILIGAVIGALARLIKPGADPMGWILTILLGIAGAYAGSWLGPMIGISGGMLGFVLLMALSMFGLAALLKASAHALLVLKWLGAAYLIWLGIQLWRAPPLHLTPLQSAAPRPGVQLFRQGLLSALSNPKVILFFGAFLPQFLDPTRSLWLQFAVMAGTFALVEGIVEYLLARMAHRVRPWLQRSGKGFNRCCGGLFALMGAALPMTR